MHMDNGIPFARMVRTRVTDIIDAYALGSFTCPLGP